jgi:hypothetical protein
MSASCQTILHRGETKNSSEVLAIWVPTTLCGKRLRNNGVIHDFPALLIDRVSVRGMTCRIAEQRKRGSLGNLGGVGRNRGIMTPSLPPRLGKV